jgi:hypothetical protein
MFLSPNFCKLFLGENCTITFCASCTCMLGVHFTGGGLGVLEQKNEFREFSIIFRVTFL